MSYVFVVNPGDVVGGCLIVLGLGCLGILWVQDALRSRRRRRRRGA